MKTSRIIDGLCILGEGFFLASDYAGYMTGEVVSVSGQHP